MSVITGIGLPSFVYLFGDVITSFQNTDPMEAFIRIAIQFLIIGGVVCVTAYIFVVTGMILAERIGKKTRVAYLRAVLK